MRRKEKVALVACCAAAVVALAYFMGAPLFSRWYIDAQLERLSARYDQSYAMGEEVVLDSELDSGAAIEAAWGMPRVSYDVALDYKGALSFKVEDADLFSDPNGAGIAIDDPHFWGGVLFSSEEYGPHEFLLCKITVRNIDAKPLRTTRWGRDAFLLPSFLGLTVGGDPWTDIVYFDSPVKDAREGEKNYFFLNPGEEHVFTVGFAIADVNGVGVKANGLSLSGGGVGMQSHPTKYQVALDVDDRRGETVDDELA